MTVRSSLYRAECWATKKWQVDKVMVIERCMLSLKIKIKIKIEICMWRKASSRNDDSRGTSKIASIDEKMLEFCLRWFQVSTQVED